LKYNRKEDDLLEHLLIEKSDIKLLFCLHFSEGATLSCTLTNKTKP